MATDTQDKTAFGVPFKPMLAQVWEECQNNVRYPCVVQPKLDGIRCCWDGQAIRSRNGNRFLGLPQLQKLLANYAGSYRLDGELFCEGLDLDEIRAVVSRKKNIAEDVRIQFWIFDIVPLAPTPYNQRRALLKAALAEMAAAGCPMERLVEVPTCVATDETAVMALFDQFSEQFEGAIYRAPQDVYKNGRSAGLLKLKRFSDCEAEVLGFAEGNGKHADSLGALRCRLIDNDGDPVNEESFEVGTGFDDETRLDVWCHQENYIGKKFTLKYQEMTKRGVPRFPSFLIWRDYE